MERLTELFNKHWSDKGTIRDEGHGYGEYYDRVFSKYKNPTILEIGIQSGGDIKAINEYYNGECAIYGIDIDPLCVKTEKDVNTFKFFCFDAGNPQNLIEFKETEIKDIMFDIIIDDGSHLWKDQMITMAYLCDKIKPEGVYIIEDLHSSLIRWDIDKRYSNAKQSDHHGW